LAVTLVGVVVGLVDVPDCPKHPRPTGAHWIMTTDPSTSPSTLNPDGERQRRDWDLVGALCGTFPTPGAATTPAKTTSRRADPLSMGPKWGHAGTLMP
jgi:hypothetical protein